jgi:hypothetical protein
MTAFQTARGTELKPSSFRRKPEVKSRKWKRAGQAPETGAYDKLEEEYK